MNKETEVLLTVQRLMPILELAVAAQPLGAEQAQSVSRDMATLRALLAPLPAPLTAPAGVAQEDLVTVLAECPDGGRAVLGHVAMSPLSKLNQLATEQYGHFSEDDLDEGAEALFLGERLLAWVQEVKPAQSAALEKATQLVTEKFGAFQADGDSEAALACYVLVTLVNWMAVAHPQRFSA